MKGRSKAVDKRRTLLLVAAVALPAVALAVAVVAWSLRGWPFKG